MKLGIIIPTYNSLNTLKVLIKNIQDYTENYNLYVVEDGQKKETIDWLKENKINSIFNKKNKGVAGSWNVGLKKAIEDNCTHFAILNDDIELPAKWWEECKKAFDNKRVHLAFLDAPSPITITGWFFIIDKYCVDKVGYFDEDFYPYYAEDDDYFIRYKQAGLRYMQIGIDVFHHGSHTIEKLDKKKSEGIRKSNLNKLVAKHDHIRRQA